MREQQPESKNNPRNHYLELFDLVSRWKFYAFCLFIFVVTIPLTYFGLACLSSSNFFETYNQLPERVKDKMSLNSLWLDTFLSLSVPVLFSLAVFIPLLKLELSVGDKSNSALQFILKLRGFFFTQIPIFFVFTAALLSGALLFLIFNADQFSVKSLFLFAFPAAIFYVAMQLKILLSTDPTQSRFGRFLLANHWVFIVLALIALFYSSVFAPLLNKWEWLIIIVTGICN